MIKVVSRTPSGKQKLISLDDYTPQWSKETLTINATETESSLDIADGANFVKYFLLAEEEGGLTTYAFEMNVFEANGSTLDTVSNKLGAMSLIVNSIVDVNGIHIDITNNEAYNITVTLTYMSN